MNVASGSLFVAERVLAFALLKWGPKNVIAGLLMLRELLVEVDPPLPGPPRGGSINSEDDNANHDDASALKVVDHFLLVARIAEGIYRVPPPRPSVIPLCISLVELQLRCDHLLLFDLQKPRSQLLDEQGEAFPLSTEPMSCTTMQDEMKSRASSEWEVRPLSRVIQWVIECATHSLNAVFGALFSTADSKRRSLGVSGLGEYRLSVLPSESASGQWRYGKIDRVHLEKIQHFLGRLGFTANLFEPQECSNTPQNEQANPFLEASSPLADDDRYRFVCLPDGHELLPPVVLKIIAKQWEQSARVLMNTQSTPAVKRRQ
jgi:hypothetical protein